VSLVRATQRPSADRPTLLMVGAGDPMDAALRVALDRHGLFVEAVGLDNLRRSVHLTAPDIILLLGDAAEAGGVTALTILAEDSSTAAVPVVLLAADTRLESRMHAFRHGAMAVVPRHASSDAIAKKIAGLSRELSEHFEEKTGEIGEGTFDELVDIVKKELRSGILSVHAPKHKGGPLRVVLGAGRPVAAAVQEFVARLKPHVTAAESMYYQFHTSAGGPVELLDMDTGGSGGVDELRRLRVLLVDDDPGRADTLAQELRGRNALVFVTDTAGRGLERAAGLDPQVAIIDAAGLEGKGFEVVRQMRRDLRLRWASILVAPWDEIWPKGAPAPDMEKLASRIAPFLAPERELETRSAAPDPFDTRLEATGPSRLLRTLVESGETMHLTIRNPKATIECDLAQGLLVGASAKLANGAELLGPAAIATMLALGSGRIHIERRSHPSVANIMSPVDEALSLASKERLSIPASEPPAAPEWSKLTVPFPKVETPPNKAARIPSVPPPAAPTVRPTAKRTEVVIDVDDEPEVVSAPLKSAPVKAPLVPPPKSAPVKTAVQAPPMGPVAANERAAKLAQRRRSTLLMGGPEEEELKAAVPPPPEPPAPEPPPVEPPAPEPPIEVRAPEGEPLGHFEIETTSDQISPPPILEREPSIPMAAPIAPHVSQAPLPPPVVAQPLPAPRPIRLPPSEPPPPRRTFARTIATISVAIAGLVLAAVLGLIGYRYSSYRHPAIDRVLVALGTTPPADPRVPPAAEPPDDPRPVEPPPVEPQQAQPPPQPVDPQPVDPQPVDPPPVEPPPQQVDPQPADPPPAEPPVDPAVDEEVTAENDVDALIRRADNSPAPLAERLYRRALELDRTNHYAMLGLARTARARGDGAAEIEHLRRAVERRPRRAAYRILLGDALRRSGDGAAARLEYESALEHEPDNAQARARLEE
jgi:DNA-binding response OmpR family regulator/outer membrane biosynthesis protein TonB